MNQFPSRSSRSKQFVLVVAMLFVSLVVTALPAKSQAEGESSNIYLPTIQGGFQRPSFPELSDTDVPLSIDYSAVQDGQSIASDVLWSADFESGSFPGGISISGFALPVLTAALVNSGRYAAALIIINADGVQRPEPGVRLTYHAQGTASPSDPKNLPDEAYYSAHYYFPTQVVAEWWNLMEWKQSVLTSPSSQTRIPVYFVSSA